MGSDTSLRLLWDYSVPYSNSQQLPRAADPTECRVLFSPHLCLPATSAVVQGNLAAPTKSIEKQNRWGGKRPPRSLASNQMPPCSLNKIVKCHFCWFLSTLSGMWIPLLWAAHSNSSPSQWRTFSQCLSWTSPGTTWGHFLLPCHWFPEWKDQPHLATTKVLEKNKVSSEPFFLVLNKSCTLSPVLRVRAALPGACSHLGRAVKQCCPLPGGTRTPGHFCPQLHSAQEQDCPFSWVTGASRLLGITVQLGLNTQVNAIITASIQGNWRGNPLLHLLGTTSALQETGERKMSREYPHELDFYSISKIRASAVWDVGEHSREQANPEIQLKDTSTKKRLYFILLTLEFSPDFIFLLLWGHIGKWTWCEHLLSCPPRWRFLASLPFLKTF